MLLPPEDVVVALFVPLSCIGERGDWVGLRVFNFQDISLPEMQTRCYVKTGGISVISLLFSKI